MSKKDNIDNQIENLKYTLLKEMDNRLSKILFSNDINDDIYYEGKNVRNCFHSEFNQYRSELSNTITSVNSFEQKVFQSFELLTNELSHITQDISTIKSTIDILSNQVKSSEDKITQLTSSTDSSFKSQDTLITNLQNDLSNLNQQFIAQSSLLQKQSDNLTQVHEELLIHIGGIETDLKRTMRLSAESLSSSIMNINKEIDHFESHILNEHSHFTQIVQSNTDEHINKINSIISYLTSDVDILRSKCDFIDNSVHKLRSDAFEAIQSTESFLLNKIKIT